MTTFQPATTIWRDKVTDGVYSSGDHDPDKSEIRLWGSWVEAGISAGTLNGPWEATKAALDAKLDYADGNPGFVYDGDDFGTYRKSGASGAGSWVKIFDFIPGYQIAKATNAGAGTANAIVATSSPPVSYSDGVQLISLNITTTNTSEDVTVAFDGGAALNIRTAANNKPAVGGLVSPVTLWGHVDASGTVFRLVSDQSGSAIQAAAEAAQAAAEAAAAAAEAAATPVNLFFETKADVEAAAIPAEVSQLTLTDVPTSPEYDRVDSEPSTAGGKIQSADGAWWELSELILNPYIFGADGGASFGSGDDTTAFLNMREFSKANDGLPMWVFPDTYRVVGEEIVLDFRAEFTGFDRHTTKIIFAGTPAKTKRTRDVWMSEYDSGDYSQESDDPAIACGILLLASKGELRDITLEAEYTVVADYTLPFDAATDYPTCGWDNAIFVGAPDCMVDNVETSGPWGNFGGNGGIRLDPTVYDTLEHVKVSNSVFRGRYGVAITGPRGQPDSGVTYMEMTSSDTRGGGGISDTVFENCECYDTQIRLSIDGNSNRLVKRYGGTGGALFVEGQIALNTAKRQQQLKFKNCRFANVDEYTIFVNYVNRLLFHDCHFEWRSGSYIEDGVTAQTASDSAGRYVTPNAMHVLFSDGEFSGETDNMTYRVDETQIITLSNVSVADDGGLTKGRVNAGTRAFVKPSWTPTLTASSGTASFSVAEAYGYVTDGVMKFNIKFVLTATSLSGPLLVSLHEDYPKANVDGDDKQLVQLAVDNATAGACGCFGIINNGGTSVVLHHQDSSGWSNMQGSDLTSSSELMISGEYVFA